MRHTVNARMLITLYMLEINPFKPSYGFLCTLYMIGCDCGLYVSSCRVSNFIHGKAILFVKGLTHHHDSGNHHWVVEFASL